MTIEEIIKGKWIKYPKPILAPGPKGEWDDALAGTPRVIKKSKNGYFLFYTGQNRKKGSWGIGVARSFDLFNWKKFKGNPILQGAEDGWDKRIDGANVFKHKNKYYLFYEASSFPTVTQNVLVNFIPFNIRQFIGRIFRKYTSSFISLGIEHAKGRAIGFATSPDLLNWVKYEGNPVLKSDKGKWDSEGVYSPAVILVGNKFYMSYSGSNGQRVCGGMAISKNLKDWEKWKGNPILKTGPKGSWDERVVNITSFIKMEDGYCLFYEGEDNKNIYCIGMAYSKNLETWIKHRDNPILGVGKSGYFDERMTCGPQVYAEDDNLCLFYVAQDRNMIGYSGLALFKKL